MRILNFGSCNIDYVYSMDHIVRVGETQSTYALDIFPGGKGLNQSIAIARAGTPVWHAGCVGNDGGMLTELLADSGVDVSYLRTVDGKNGHAIIQVSAKGENSIFLFGGSNEMVSKDFIDGVLADFDAGDILLLQNEISNVPYIIEKAYEKGMCIVFNPSPIHENIKEIDFRMLSYIMINEVEAKEITGCDAVEGALAFFRERYPDLRVILTLGEQGSVYMDGDQKIRQAAFLTDAVDTTAAGDTFTGYFVSGISSGIGCAEALRMASAAVAISVSRNGAAPSIPKRCEVLERIGGMREDRGNYKREAIQRQILSYMEEHIGDASLEGLAELLRYSTVYTGTLVKELTGMTFCEYLQNYRCGIAAKMLLRTDLSIGEIIDRVGYENKSFFRAKFKEKYGKNPLEYRKNGG